MTFEVTEVSIGELATQVLIRAPELARSRQHREAIMNAGTILRNFYDAVQRRDMAKARTYLDDDMTFVGLFETYPNADAYIATFTQLLQIVTRLEVRIIIGEGDHAAIFMDMVTTDPVAATTLVAEWHQTRNGKIVRAQSAFDGRPFAAMFAAPRGTPSH